MISGTKWWHVVAAGCLAAASSLGSGGGGGGDTNKIKIGSLQSLTGDTSTFGQSSKKGIELAVDERNKAGGVLGKQIEVVTRDDQSKAEQVPQAVLQLIEQDKVVAILGEVASGRTLAAAADVERHKIPLLSPASTATKVTEAGEYVFRSCFTDDQQGKWMVEFVAKNLKFKKAALMVDTQSPYSVGLGKVIESEFPKTGGTILIRENYATPQKDFKTQLTNIRAQNPDIVFLPGYYTEIVNILPQARELGITASFIGGDGWDSDQTIKVGKEAVNGCYFTNHYAPEDPDPKVQAFVKKYKERFNGETPDAMAVLAYDAANIMFEAIQRAGSTEGAKIKESLSQTKDFDGVTGKITIGKDRNAIKPGVVLEIDNGKHKLVAHMGRPEEAATKP